MSVITRDDMKIVDVNWEHMGCLYIITNGICRVFYTEQEVGIYDFPMGGDSYQKIIASHKSKSYKPRHLDSLDGAIGGNLPTLTIPPTRETNHFLVIKIDTDQPDYNYSFKIGPPLCTYNGISRFGHVMDVVPRKHIVIDMNKNILPPHVDGRYICTIGLRPKPRFNNAVKIIQNRWRKIYYDPQQPVCRRQLESLITQGHLPKKPHRLICSINGMVRLTDTIWQNDNYNNDTINIEVYAEYARCKMLYYIVVELRQYHP